MYRKFSLDNKTKHTQKSDRYDNYLEVTPDENFQNVIYCVNVAELTLFSMSNQTYITFSKPRCCAKLIQRYQCICVTLIKALLVNECIMCIVGLTNGNTDNQLTTGLCGYKRENHKQWNIESYGMNDRISRFKLGFPVHVERLVLNRFGCTCQIGENLKENAHC